MVWTLFFKQQLSSSWPSTYLVGFHVYSNQPCYHSLTRNILKKNNQALHWPVLQLRRNNRTPCVFSTCLIFVYLHFFSNLRNLSVRDACGASLCVHTKNRRPNKLCPSVQEQNQTCHPRQRRAEGGELNRESHHLLKDQKEENRNIGEPAHALGSSSRGH